MPQKPEIAVLVSTYQRPWHLRRALIVDRIAARPEHAMEVVVTDDGSTDETPHVVEEFAANRRFSRAVHHASARYFSIGPLPQRRRTGQHGAVSVVFGWRLHFASRSRGDSSGAASAGRDDGRRLCAIGSGNIGPSRRKSHRQRRIYALGDRRGKTRASAKNSPSADVSMAGRIRRSPSCSATMSAFGEAITSE